MTKAVNKSVFKVHTGTEIWLPWLLWVTENQYIALLRIPPVE